MAEKRMISKVISVSEKVNLRLEDTFHMLLYTWMIPHADDFGRLTGSPAKLRALVVPMLNKTISDVDFALKCLHDAELILWYEADGDKYIQIINFEEHQSGLHKRTKSKIPDPPEKTYEFPGNSGNVQQIPSELNRTEQKGTEENRTELKEAEGPRERLRKLTIECGLKGVGIDGLDTIYSYIGQVDVEVIEKAIRKAEKKHVPYFVTVINGWIEEGKTTTELINPIPKGGDPPENKLDSQSLTSRFTKRQ